MRKYLILFFSVACLVFRGQLSGPDSLTRIFHEKFKKFGNNGPGHDTILLNEANRVSSAYLESNNLYSALKYNIIEKQFYDKHSVYHGDAPYMDRFLYRCMYNRIMILERKENYNSALDLAFSLLQHFEGVPGQLEKCAMIEEEIGYIYYLFRNHERALHFYQKSCDLIKSTGDLLKTGSAYNNLYGIYSAIGDKNTAIKYCFSALNCFKKINHRNGMRVSYSNLALYYKDINIDKALSYCLLSQALKPDSIDILNPGKDENMLGGLYLKKASKEKRKDLKTRYLNKSEAFYIRAKQIALLLNNKNTMKECLDGLSNLEHEKNNFEKAYGYLRLYNLYKDSLSGEEETRASVRSLMKYEFDKKEREQRLVMEKKEAVRQKELEKQKLQKYFFIIVFVIVSVLAVFILRGFKTIQKAHRLIWKQKQLVENKQSQLLHSINYAQRIQNNLLKSESDLRDIVPEAFIIFKPRDIVSGDFYWFIETEKGEIIIILADCTGHGVPGALLSMIGITALNEIIGHQKIYDPAEILWRLSSDVHGAFSKDKDLTKVDGMDFSVCKISGDRSRVYFAGVNQCLYAFSENAGLIKTEPQINSVNGIFDIKPEDVIKTEEILVKEKTFFYLFSDGIIDQIGEKTNKKYLSRRFEENLVSPKSLKDISAQKEKIISSLAEWQGNYKQIDDITVIGFSL